MTRDDDDRFARLERLVTEQAQAIDEQRQVIDRLVAERRTPGPVVPTQPRPGRNRPESDGADGVSRRDVLRRALIAGGAVAAGSAALAVAEAAPAAAATGDALKAGQQTNTEASTVLFADAPAASYPYGIASVTDTQFDQFTNQDFSFGAVTGISTHGPAIGVAAYGASLGLFAASDGGSAILADGTIGIQAVGTTSYALHATTGPASSATAVYAEAHSNGTAIEAHGTATGNALQAYGTSEFIGSTVFLGRTYFAASGTVRVRGTKRRPSRSAVVTGVALARTSKVIATIQGDGGAVGVAGVTLNVAKKTFTVTLTGKVARYVTVAWFVID
jgi:hypothetical protein